MARTAEKRDALLLGLELADIARRGPVGLDRLHEITGKDRWYLRKVMERLAAEGWVERLPDPPLRYRAGRRVAPTPSLTKSDRRAVSLLRAMATWCAPYEDVAGVRALMRKIASSLDLDAFRRDDPLVTLLDWKPKPGAMGRKEGRLVNAVACAVEGDRALRLRYRAVREVEPSVRVVSPQRLLRWNHLMYIVAWDHGKKGMRSFALTRCERVEVARCKRRVCAATDVEAYIHRPFGVFQGNGLAGSGGVERVVIDFDEEVARYAEEVRWHPTQKVDRVRGRARLMLDVPVAPDLVGWVLSFQGKATPQHPPMLVEEVLDASLAMIEALLRGNPLDQETLERLERVPGQLRTLIERTYARIEREIDRSEAGGVEEEDLRGDEVEEEVRE